ncbi:MAG: hypothetical protein J6K92_12490 [Oscillospiraceae bacterium]|nr:hypothetical protein [Oscillospiraceae bacterium]
MGRMKQLSAEAMRKNTAKANKGGFITKKASMVVYLIVLVLAVAARTIQLYSNMDFTTGLYIDPSPMKNYTLFVLLIGLVLLAAVLIAGSSKDKVIGSCILINPMRLRYDRLKKKIPSAAGFSALLMALLIAAEIIFYFVTLVTANKEIVKTLSEEEAEYYSMLTGYSWGMFFYHFLMVLVMLNFIAMAVNIFKSEGPSSGNCAAFSLYALWKIIDMMTIISNHVAASRYSEYIYEILSYMTAVMFFMNTARFFNGMEKKSTRFWMCMTGYTASILAAVSVIPRYILFIIPTDYDSRLSMNIPRISDIGIVFMTITIIAVFWSTYVYRVMPRLNIGKRRWSRAPMNKQYLEIENIDVKPVDKL